MCALKHSAQCWGTQAHAQGKLTLQFGKYNMAHHAPPQMPRYLLCGA
ncbi:TonB-dependent receptor [Acetobacter orientalis]|uniref:TonB-dependent receptor n=1 Tax=Acetobacter orientalis TaxID=146474 RepID=A0A2Z5ZHX3_9PROT|nr:TonB-dependent receptor [Acetobacter orientalis]